MSHVPGLCGAKSRSTRQWPSRQSAPFSLWMGSSADSRAGPTKVPGERRGKRDASRLKVQQLDFHRGILFAHRPHVRVMCGNLYFWRGVVQSGSNHDAHWMTCRKVIVKVASGRCGVASCKKVEWSCSSGAMPFRDGGGSSSCRDSRLVCKRPAHTTSTKKKTSSSWATTHSTAREALMLLAGISTLHWLEYQTPAPTPCPHRRQRQRPQRLKNRFQHLRARMFFLPGPVLLCAIASTAQAYC